MMAEMAAEQSFQEQRPRLFSLAYRMLGSAADAEDVLQDAWLRWQAADAASIESAGAWLTTVVTRLCLDQLKSARHRRENYVGPWLPEPLPTEPVPDRESISMAFLVLLEQLTPAERATYLLHEVFDYSHGEIAEILGTTAANCRQLALRAKAHLRERRPRFAPTVESHERLLARFLSAVQGGQLEPLKQLLSDDVLLRSDGGGKAAAALRPIVGSERVARFFLGLAGKMVRHPLIRFRILSVNGWPALVTLENGRIVFVLSIESDGQRIHALYSVLNPDKLVAVERALRSAAVDS
ncbi:MAG TPA: sigma-70 family RNA polymerase sigma factor [Polyangiaceae bacterium]|nr:sigma-70 family RNA polymerase sigma factor [Polyangiaceae bacterium]